MPHASGTETNSEAIGTDPVLVLLGLGYSYLVVILQAKTAILFVAGIINLVLKLLTLLLIFDSLSEDLTVDKWPVRRLHIRDLYTIHSTRLGIEHSMLLTVKIAFSQDVGRLELLAMVTMTFTFPIANCLISTAGVLVFYLHNDTILRLFEWRKLFRTVMDRLWRLPHLLSEQPLSQSHLLPEQVKTS